MGKTVLITAARVATSATAAVRRKLWLHNGLVYFSPCKTKPEITVDLSGFLVLPGLINAHDHLEFNLFPRLGRGPYPNATVWAKDIFRPHQSPIRDHLAVPKTLRLIWGGIKNLLSGVTTVAHHNSYHLGFDDASFPVRVIKRYGWAHSIHFSPDWLARFQRTSDRYPFIIHAGEGSDESARQEILLLASMGALGPSTVLVHGVSLRRADAALMARQGSSLVWCPSSNHFTLGRTVHPEIFDSEVLITLGTDSGMTGAGDLFDELQAAQPLVDGNRLYRMVTSDARQALRLPPGFGDIRDGGPADFLIVPDTGQTPAEALRSCSLQAVMVAGEVRLSSTEFAAAYSPMITRRLQPLHLETRGEYLIAYDVHSLARQTSQILDGQLRLAGKAVAA
jgi:cytosine/adenosine deaminase-related metal-dependent hydrolase